MVAMTATTNQQYYSSYPVGHQSVGMMSASQGSIQSSYQPQVYSGLQHQQMPATMSAAYHPQHHNNHQQHVPLANSQSSAAPRTVSASTNSSTCLAAAIYNMAEATKSTKGASKMRRDLINAEIVQLRELLPLPANARQRLSQLQLMALVLVFVRKSNYFRNAFEHLGILRAPTNQFPMPPSGFSKALNGFLMMMTQKGKLLYISDNAAEYLGHSMEDLLSHGDEVYDIVEDQDKKTIRTELLLNDDDSQNSPSSKSLQQSNELPSSETRIALCRMNVSRNARRQMRFGDQKVVLVEGHYFGYLPLTSRHEPVFMATCTPVAMPETRECVVQGSTNVFTTIHSMDMKLLYIDAIGEHHLGYTKQQVHGMSWYELVHFDYLHEAQLKHKRITASDQEPSTIVLLRLMNRDQTNYLWVHVVMQVKKATDDTSQSVIVCTNQVLSEREAQVMRNNQWLYQFYSLHSKMHCNYSSQSPAMEPTQTATPNSVCSDSEADLVKSSSGATALATINTSSSSSSSSTSSSSEALTKSPPANLISGGGRTTSLLDDSSAFEFQKNNYNADAYADSNYQPIHQVTTKPLQKGGGISSKSPATNSASPSSIYPASQHQRYHQLQSATNPPSNHLTDIGGARQHAHNHSSVGSPSASSISSSSSSSQNDVSTTPNASNNLTQNVAQTMVAVAATNSTTAAAAASLYAGIDAMDPLQHMHHSHHHHPMYSTGTTNQHHPSHHAAAAVNYANQVMAAQRVAQQQQQSHHHHHHHQPYHPYHRHQHHSSAHNHSTPSHVAPHHHSNHTTPLYPPPHHHVAAASASSAALNSAFGHHHHAAAYHSAVSDAAVAAHPAHHHANNTIQNPYHAVAAAAHQGVSFHYNRLQRL